MMNYIFSKGERSNIKPDQKKQKSAKGGEEERLRERRVQRGKPFGEERGREMLTFAAVFLFPPPLFSMRCSSLAYKKYRSILLPQLNLAVNIC